MNTQLYFCHGRYTIAQTPLLKLAQLCTTWRPLLCDNHYHHHHIPVYGTASARKLHTLIPSVLSSKKATTMHISLLRRSRTTAVTLAIMPGSNKQRQHQAVKNLRSISNAAAMPASSSSSKQTELENKKPQTKQPSSPIPPTPRPSSSVILLSPTNEVLLLHRVRTSSSFPSAHVFPGGNVSNFHDHYHGNGNSGVSSDEVSSKVGVEVGSASAFETDDVTAIHRDGPAYRLAAIRETFEESGLLLARPRRSQRSSSDGGGETGLVAGDVDTDALLTIRNEVGTSLPDATASTGKDTVSSEERITSLTAARKAVHANQLHFPSWVTQTLNAELCVDELVPFTRWVTPPGPPKRFTTQMYLFLMPFGDPSPSSSSSASSSSSPLTSSTSPLDANQGKEVTVQHTPTSDGGIEHTAAAFAPVTEWLERQRNGEIVLFPPQLFLLTMLARVFETADAAFATTTPAAAAAAKGGNAAAEQRSRYEAQRRALLEFIRGTSPPPPPLPSTPAAKEEQSQQSPMNTSKTSPHPTATIPWTHKIISPTVLFVRARDKKVVLGLDKPGPELKGISNIGGDFDRVVLVNFGKGGPRDVEVRDRKDVLREEREYKESKAKANI